MTNVTPSLFDLFDALVDPAREEYFSHDLRRGFDAVEDYADNVSHFQHQYDDRELRLIELFYFWHITIDSKKHLDGCDFSRLCEGLFDILEDFRPTEMKPTLFDLFDALTDPAREEWFSTDLAYGSETVEDYADNIEHFSGCYSFEEIQLVWCLHARHIAWHSRGYLDPSDFINLVKDVLSIVEDMRAD